MGATKIINVLKDDKFEELLDIVKDTDASEVVFVLPKKAKAFRLEDQFLALETEIKKGDKSVAFLCSDPETNELAKKYGFDVLSTKTESVKPRLINSQIPLKSEAVAIPIIAEADDIDDDLHEEKELESSEEAEVIEEIPTEKDGEEDEESEEAKNEFPPYGTEVDESGDPIYEEEEEEIGEAVVASAKTRGMSDVVRPAAGKNLRVVQKDKRTVKVETRTEDDDIQSVWGQESADNIWADIAKPRVPKKGLGFAFGYRSFLKKGVGILTLASIVILAIVVYLTTGSARIEIKPRAQELSTQLKVIMSPNFSSVDNSFNRIPGQLFTISKSASDNFSTTAEKDAVQKSRGVITIYNEYGTSPQPLVATTRFEYIQNGKESGLIFRTLQSVIVPGMKVENGAVSPGKINVEVIADKAGQNYNISASNFGIMSWREKGDTARYEKIYGRSSDSMHGGILGKAKVVSEFDYNNAKDQLTKKINNDVSEALNAQSAGLELITGIQPKIDSIESTAEIDDAADKFTMTVNGSITTIGFNKEDLLSLISNHIDKTSGLMLVPEKLELSYKNEAINTASNTLEVVVIIGGQGYAKIDRESITTNLMGKNEAQIKDYLGSIKDVDSAKVILSPFWVKKVPKNKSDIDISLTF
ncbi:MAG: hypothetical protein A2655_04305 [Candidatus Yanofskybacteria bacterium RIFCSPHIGHO2_01_FULL_43_42]|uniref:Baseplate protein J-like domain-containing protein n=1 Tax=Candidatus Yanofskybacteria bacterium RIFCSPLOWO2_01_FULL_43_22 TaxID=1802695 RepID=A0A1F8GF37_9BACT|nr:MAG: hypothetical protein A2655_04305 [Candidatus Yanofskybacteria bacterium RIFCSPHIGHO2_01_FULL_43_42]OGN12714.1 MAG: hypothetical protein A3D48_01655 [Candidatus Yanofskybacteria bacterium RIFCSPHIGHO2_02_FULL_43_17]OGN23336.1 MAG: hypothetical protein A3A13_04425 [Candidatus Yanofskybacteria bacterium RIFCSPLOWO2_01_FULL_43_22]